MPRHGRPVEASYAANVDRAHVHAYTSPCARNGSSAAA